MPDDIIQLPADSSGKKLRTRSRTVGANAVHEQYFLPTTEEVISYWGRANSFRIPGAAGTTGQHLATLFNASGSAVLVKLNRVTIDFVSTVIKAVTVLPVQIRIQRTTTLPTGGAAIGKGMTDSALTSNASVTLLQGASADGTGVAITATPISTYFLAQEFGPRLITAAGYEMFDRTTFFEGETDITLRAAEGIVVELAYTLATQNPTTDAWIVGLDWIEYTLP